MGKLISLCTMREIEIPHAVIGQMVRYTGDMANLSGIGAVVNIREESLFGKYDVALQDGREFRATSLDSSRWQLLDEFAVGDTLDILRAGIAARKATDEAAQTSAAEEFERIKAKLKAHHPYLIAGGNLDCTQAAKNLRIELKRAFPGIKFGVRTSRFSGGDSIDVDWTDGPMLPQVQKFANKYSGGSFDGMTDSYEYSRSPWIAVFGDAKYVHCHRHYSDQMVTRIIARVCAHLAGMEATPTLEDYRHGKLWQFKQSGGCDVEREIHQALAKHTYCLTKEPTA